MHTIALFLLAILLPLLSQAQFTIGQTTGANVTYYDFPDTTVCSLSLDTVAIDLDGDNSNELVFRWEARIQEQHCIDRELMISRFGMEKLQFLPESEAQGNNLLSQMYGQWDRILSYCSNYLDSTFIQGIYLDMFWPGTEAYFLFKLDSVGLDYAWLRAESDTTGGNYCVTFKDAARYRPPVAVDPLADAGAGLQVFPTIVADALWIKGIFKKPVRLDVKFFAIDGRQLGQTEVVFPGGQARLEVAYPSAVSGVVLMEISGENVRKVEKLIFSK